MELEASDLLPDRGFYEQVYQQGSTWLISKRRKILEENHDMQRIRFLVADADLFYLVRGNQIYPITGKSALRRAYPMLTREMRRFQRQQRLDFQRDFEHAVVSTVAFCEDSL